MRIVFTSYISCPEFNDPHVWLERIKAHAGILEELAKLHVVISIERINFEGAIEKNGVYYYFTKLPKPKVHFPLRLHRIIKSFKPDVVFINGMIFPLQVIQLKYFIGKEIKIVAQNHAEKPFAGWRRMLQRKADQYIEGYFFTSKQMGLEWVEKKIISTEKKVVEVMEASSAFRCIDKKKAKSITNSPGAPMFLWVGRLNANKDPITVVKTFLKFIQQQPSAKLYMIYHTEELLNEVKELTGNANNNIQLIGKIPHHELQTWYNSADFIISGSHYEGSGVAVCEAMSCGCIPIITNIASFRKMTGNGKCGMLYEPGSQQELLSALLKTKNISLNLEKEKTMQQFNQELSFEAIAAKMNEVINTLESNV